MMVEELDSETTMTSYIDRLVSEHCPDDREDEDESDWIPEGEEAGEADSNDDTSSYDVDDLSWFTDNSIDSYQSLMIDEDVSDSNHGNDSANMEDVVNSNTTHLNWRMPPEESFSDWTIEIKADDGIEGIDTEIYHVHRCVLGVGCKKSSYFESIFSSEQFQESQEHKSTICFSDTTSIAAVPDFFDYMYSLSAAGITYKNFSQLRDLARYFIVPKLLEDTKEFVKSDMHKLDHVHLYTAYFANNEQDEDSQEIIACAVCSCVKRIRRIKPESQLLLTMPLAFLISIFSGVRDSLEEGESALNVKQQVMNHVARLVLSYASHNRESLNEATFTLLFNLLYTTRVKHVGEKRRLFNDHSYVLEPVDYPYALNLLELIKSSSLDEGPMRNDYFFWSWIIRKSVKKIADHFIQSDDVPTEAIIAKLPEIAKLELMKILIKKGKEGSKTSN